MTTKVVVIKASELRENAQVAFGEMQRSWYFFAKTVTEIQDSEAWREYGFDNFKEYCLADFSTINYETIIKFNAIVKKWGKAIDTKLEHDKTVRLPAYESCYQLTTVEDKIPKEELSKLRKAVLDCKLSYADLRERLKDIISISKRKEVKKSIEESEQELLQDLSGDIEEVDPDIQSSVPKLVAGLRIKLTFVKDNLPFLVQALEQDPDSIDSSVIELAEELDAVSESIEEFLNKVEETQG